MSALDSLGCPALLSFYYLGYAIRKYRTARFALPFLSAPTSLLGHLQWQSVVTGKWRGVMFRFRSGNVCFVWLSP